MSFIEAYFSVSVEQFTIRRLHYIPGTAKLCLSPRQSRGCPPINYGLYKELKGSTKEMHRIGDCANPHAGLYGIGDAIYDGHRLGRLLQKRIIVESINKDC